jgi:hypothetical protein
VRSSSNTRTSAEALPASSVAITCHTWTPSAVTVAPSTTGAPSSVESSSSAPSSVAEKRRVTAAPVSCPSVTPPSASTGEIPSIRTDTSASSGCDSTLPAVSVAAQLKR